MRTSSSTSDDSSTLAQIRQSRPMTESTICDPAPIVVPSPIRVRPRRITFGSRKTSCANSTEGSTYAVEGSAIETPARIQAVVDLGPQVALRLGQLEPVVDAEQPAVVLDDDRGDPEAVLAGEPDEVGEVQLAARRRGPQVADPAPQPGGLERVDPGIDLGDLELI